MALVTGFLSPFLFVVQLAGTPAPSDSVRIAAREEAPVYYLPPLRITAPRPLFPGSRLTLNRNRFELHPAEQAAEALTRVAGLRVLSFGDASTRAVSIRGLGPDRTAVLVDGVPRNIAQGGPVDLGTWNLDSVELIQVSRGAMGALYGPYALGGAVNLERRRERVSAGSLRLSAGTLDRASMALQGTLGLNRSTLSGTLGYENVAPELAGQTAESETKHGGIRAAWYPRWASSVALSLEGRSDARDVPGTDAFPSPEARRHDTSGTLTLTAAGMRSSFIPGHLDLSATGLRFERRYEDPGYPLGSIEDEHINRQTGVNLSWRTETRGISTTVRGEAARDQLTSTTDGSHERDRAASAVLVEAHRGRWQASGALRLDAFEGFAPELTGRAALGRHVFGTPADRTSVSLRAGSGTSFRPPTFDDLFWPARASAAGNPSLLPERSWDLDLGIETRSGRTELSLSAFHNEVRDLIQWSPGPDGVWRPHNLGLVRMRGLELDARTAWKAFSIDASLSRLNATDVTGDRVTGGKELVGRSRWTGSGLLTWTPGALTLSAGCHGNDRTPVTPSNTKWLSGYLLWDASLGWNMRPNVRLVFEGRNLLDTPHEDIRGYASPGREFLLTFQLRSRGDS